MAGSDCTCAPRVELAAMCEALAECSINIDAISAIEGVEHGVVRLVTIESDVLSLELTDKVGKLAQIGSALSGAGVHIEYLYGSVGQRGTSTRIVVKASDQKRAQEILQALPEK
jgi:hypothetical protein